MGKWEKPGQKVTERHDRAAVSARNSKMIFHIGAFFLAAAMLFSTLFMSGVFAVDEGGITPFAATKDTTLRVSDTSTVNTYESFLLSDKSARYAGRIWTDKSVYALGKGEPSREIEVDGTKVTLKDDFLEIFSAMGSALTVNGEKQIPLDVMFIMDMSGSMSQTVTNKDGSSTTRLDNAIKALDDAFAMVMQNPDNRAGLYLYSGMDGYPWGIDVDTEDGVEVLPLGKYNPGDNGKYFSYRRPGGTIPGGSPKVYLDVNADVEISKKSYLAIGATNTQMGLYHGMNALASASEPETGTKDLSERKPVVILITDGQPTMTSSIETWWDPAGTPGTDYIGMGRGNFFGNAFLTMATAAYMRTQITGHYHAEGVTSLYLATIGIDLGALTKNDTNYQSFADSQEFALTTLNPAGLDSTGNSAPSSRIVSGGPGLGGTIYETITAYINNTSGTQTLLMGRNDNLGVTDPKKAGYYTFRHPNGGEAGGWDLKKVEDLYYNDYFESAVSGDLGDVLTRILSVAMQSTIDVPIEGTGELDTDEANMLSYSDPIGDYMDVKSVLKLRLLGVEYEIKDNGDDTYSVIVPDGKNIITNYCYGQDSDKTFDLTKIKIRVEEKDSDISGLKKYTLRVDIPAAAVPVRTATVDLDVNKKVESYVTNYSSVGETYVLPLRLFYTVGMQEKYLTTGTRTVDLTKIDESYKQTHRNPVTGHISFYANYFSGEQYIYSGGTDIIGADYDKGDALATFSPAESNRYYIYQDYLPLYTEKGNPSSTVKNFADIKSNNTYYFGFKYYTKPNAEIEVDGVKKTTDGIETIEIERLGSMFGSGVPGASGFGGYLVWYNPGLTENNVKPFSEDTVLDGDGWIVATKLGGIRVGNMGDHSEDGLKDAGNVTKTSTTYYLPTISGDTTNDNVILTSFLGNNGELSVSDAEIMITKEVVYDPEQVTEEMISDLRREEKFSFTLNLQPYSDFSGTLNPIVVTYDEQSGGCKWRARIEKIELVPNNQGLLIGNNGRLATYNDDYYLFVGLEFNNGKPVYPVLFNAASDGSLTDMDNAKLSVSGVRLLPKDKYSTVGNVNPDDLLESTIDLEVGEVDFLTGTIGAEVSTSYKVITTYETKEIKFNEGKATFSLNHLTGLLFTGISGGNYIVTETLTPEQIAKGIGLNHINCEEYQQVYDGSLGSYKLQKTASVTFDNVTEDTDGTVDETVKFKYSSDSDRHAYSVTSETAGDIVDHVHYCNDYIPASLIVPKRVIGAPITGDKYTFKITLTAPEGTTFLGYYAAYIHPTNHKVSDGAGSTRPCKPSDFSDHQSMSIQVALKGESTYTFDVTELFDTTDIILDDGESFVILGLPAGTTYEIEEIIKNSQGEVRDDYRTTITDSGRDVENTPRFEHNDDERTSGGELNSEVHRKKDPETGTAIGYINPVKVTYENSPKIELPVTGGMGTWLFRATGILLIVSSPLVLLKRKRRA